MENHNHGTTSNTDECFRTFIGCTVKGLLRDSSMEGSTTILVFECGWGLAIYHTGTHWTVKPEDVQSRLRSARASLRNTHDELKHLLELAGEA